MLDCSGYTIYMTRVEAILAVIDEVKARGSARKLEPRILPGVNLDEAEKWLARGDELDRQAKWNESANIYWSLFTKATEPAAKVRYGERVVQMCVNVGDYGKASKILGELMRIGEGIEAGEEKQRVAARVSLRQAWIADVQDRPEDEMKLLKKAKEFTEKIAEGQRDDEDRKRLSTIIHFTGRANYALAVREKEPERRVSYLNLAQEDFEMDLEAYRRMEPSVHKTSGMGYNLAWLARVAIEEKHLEEAERWAEEAIRDFNEVAGATGSGVILHHVHRLRAELAICRGDNEEAVRQATEALRILIPDGSYYDGVLNMVRMIITATATEGEKD